MAFVKLDCGILDSTLWVDKDARDIFITAILMAEPRQIDQPTPQLEVRNLQTTGFMVPPGWGTVRPCGWHRHYPPSRNGPGTRFGRIGALNPTPDSESRSPDFDGRRLVRIDGGYIVLKLPEHRQKDHTAAETQARDTARKPFITV